MPHPANEVVWRRQDHGGAPTYCEHVFNATEFGVLEAHVWFEDNGAMYRILLEQANWTIGMPTQELIAGGIGHPETPMAAVMEAKKHVEYILYGWREARKRYEPANNPTTNRRFW